MSLPFTPLFIDGQHRASSTNTTFEVRNPQSQEVVGISASASSQDCRDAVDAAGRAFLTWEHVSLNQKRDIFLRAADIAATTQFKDKLIERMKEEIAAITYWSTGNWASVKNSLRIWAGLVNELRGESLSSGTIPGAQVVTQRRAIGVIFANAPVTLSLRAIAIPIICGNTVVLKASEYSPRSQALAVELFEEAGLPKGVLNLISMSRESSPALTAEIIAHPLVRKINLIAIPFRFTGSDRVGKILAIEAAKYLKSCVLELGGKAPVVVLDDANIQEAAKAIVFGAMAHSGQICMSTERVVVQRGAYEALISAVSTLCSSLKAGDPAVDPAVKLSPLFTKESAENVLNLIREAENAGAKVLVGDVTSQGSVVQPHLLTGVKPGMKIWERESFGPVLGFIVVGTLDEAVEMANASEYSLTSALWTTNLHTTLSVAPRIRAGSVNINGPTIYSEPLWGLIGLGGASGYGRFDIENFTDKRMIISHPPSERQYPIF